MAEKSVLLYMITLSELGGAQSHVLELIRGFEPHYKVLLATSTEGYLTEQARALGVPVYLLPDLQRSIHPVKDWRAVQSCIQLIQQVQPQLIHAHSSKAGIIARLAGWLTRTPVVFSAHSWAFTPGLPTLQRWIGWLIEKTVAPLSARLICVSESDRQLALRWGVGDRQSLITIHNGVSNEPVPLAEPAKQPPRLIMVARLSPPKDHQTLIQALAALDNRNIHLDLVGSGNLLGGYQTLVQQMGLSEQVHFLGDRTDIPELLAQAHIFVLTSHSEGFPITILEAMRAGLPVIATNLKGIPEAVSHEQTGLLVPKANVVALQVALERLIQSPELRQRMGNAGRQKFIDEFTESRMLSKVQQVYEQVLQ